MPIIPQDDIVKFLMWACGLLGSGLVATLVYMAVGLMTKLTKMETSSQEQFSAFGKQLSGVSSLLTEDIHRHDVRIVRLEEWRKAVDKSIHGE